MGNSRHVANKGPGLAPFIPKTKPKKPKRQKTEKKPNGKKPEKKGS